MPLYEGEHIGASIALQPENDADTAATTLLIRVFREDGTPFNEGSTVTFAPGQGAVYDFGMANTGWRQERFVLRVSDETDPQNAAEQSIEVYKGEWAELDKDCPADPASESMITAFQAQLPHPICDDHRAFLSSVNGLRFAWWNAPEWPRDDAFYKALNEALEDSDNHIGLLSDVSCLFGLVPEHPGIGYPEQIGDMGFFEPDFLQEIIPVGVDGGGNLIVQALSGDRRGRIYFYDHEYHFGLREEAIGALRGEGEESFWDILGEEALIPVAGGFDDMWSKLTRHHHRAMERLASFRSA